MMTDNHSELLESFKAISAVLERHGVTYYGVYGTAIGAVRHNGFIPWDDDLDIGIFAKDLDLVSKILKEELDPDKFYYHQPSADSHPHVIYKGPDFEERLKNRSVSFIDLQKNDQIILSAGYEESLSEGPQGIEEQLGACRFRHTDHP